jgi:tetratricopeptide (TPR) repeat protein
MLLLLVLAPQLVDRTKAPELPPSAEELTSQQRADIYMARKMYREAVETYSLALSQDPKDSRIYNKLGIAYHHQLRFDDARKSYERAVKFDKVFSQAINNLGTVYYAKGKYKKAAKMYQKALKYSPNSASIHSNLGTAHFARGKYKQAAQEYVIALQLDPTVFEARGSVGTLLQERSVTDKPKYFYFMAQAYAQVGLYDKALLSLRRSIEEGFNKLKQVAEDPVFAPLLENPEFQQLVFPGQTPAQQTAAAR